MKIIIKDKYLRKKGSTYKILDISCSGCDTFIFTYQKDGTGFLKRCYLNRILAPAEYADWKNQYNDDKKMVAFHCPNCKKLIATPTNYHDERLAYHLQRGNFKKTLNKLYGKDKK